MEVFKYLCPKRMDFFETFSLRFSQPAVLNDPYECLPAFKEANEKEIVRDFITRNRDVLSGPIRNKAQLVQSARQLKKTRRLLIRWHKNNPEALQKQYLEDVNKKIGILSLSRRSDSVVMWAHYGAKHSGFVLGFDPEHPFFKQEAHDPECITSLQPVVYASKRLELDMARIVIDPNIFLTKNDDWDYEQEMRLIRPLKQASAVKEGNPPVYLFDIPKDSLKSVIFGKEFAKDVFESVVRTIQKDKCLAHVRLEKAFMNHKCFRMGSSLAQLPPDLKRCRVESA
jgi:hypothetical protein